MSFTKTKLINGEIRLSSEEGTVTLGLGENYARILDVEATKELGPLIDAALTFAAREGKQTLVYDFSNENQAYEKSLRDAGFEVRETNSIISFSTRELLSSAGVEKSLRMKFPKMESFSFYDMMSFQKEEVGSFLEKHHFPVNSETFEKIDEHLSAITYDDKYTPRAILLASRGEDEILVNLLLGFSAKNPLYMLSVCQKFAEGLISGKLQEDYPTISMLTLNDNVVPLVRRLLDKEYDLKTTAMILHFEASPEDRGVEFEDREGDDDDLWGKASFLFQDNINEKYTWAMEKKKR